MIYLDNNATTPLKPAVKQAMLHAMDVFGNPSSVHQSGRDARMAIDTARRQVASLLNVRAEQVVFTSGGSESVTAALWGAMRVAKGKRLLTTAAEHAVTIKTVQDLQVEGFARVTLLPTTKGGTVKLEALENELKKGDVALISLMHANNETGVINPIKQVIDLAHRYGAWVHVDACQTVGKIPVDMAALEADMLSVSFHKLAGPKGVGALLMRNEVEVKPLIHGGGQERNRRSGTENVLAIIGAGAAAEAAQQTLATQYASWVELQKLLENGLKNISQNIEICGANEERMPHTTMAITPGLEGEMAVMALDLSGFAVSSGSACSSGRVEPSRVLLALGYSETEARCGLRIALGWQTTADDVSAFLQAFAKIYTVV